MIVSPLSGYLLRESQERQQEARRARYGTGPVSLRGSLTDAYDTVSTRTSDVVFEFGDVARARQDQEEDYDHLLAGGDVLRGGKPITHVMKSGLLVEVGTALVRGQDGSTAMGWAVSFSRNGELVGAGLIQKDTRVVENADGTVSLEAAPDGETLDGSEEDDFFIRLSDRQVHAGGGDDVVISLGGSGGVEGGTGNDAILGVFRGVAAEGPEGLALLDGGEGDDLIRADNGVHVALVGGAGDDTLDGAVAHSLVRGGAGDDTLKGKAHYAVMDGEDGDDRYEMDLAAWSQVAGGNGDDELTGTFLRSDMAGGEGDDTFDGRFQVSDLLGESGDDTFRGLYERGRADGGEGDDAFAVEAAHTTEFAGGVGDDTLRAVTSFFASYDGGDGRDVVELGRKRHRSPSGEYVPGGVSPVGWRVVGLAGDYYAEGDLAYNEVRGGEGADDLTVYGAPDDRSGLDTPARVNGGKGLDVVAIYGALQRLGQLHGDEEDGEMGVLLLPYV